MPDEFELMREIQQKLTEATPQMSARILNYLRDWNNARPLPPAGDK